MTAKAVEEVMIQRKRHCPDLIIISTSSKLKKIFDVIIIMLALYSTYTSTYLYNILQYQMYI